MLGGVEREKCVQGRGDSFARIVHDVEAGEPPVADAAPPRREVESPIPSVVRNRQLKGRDRAVVEGVMVRGGRRLREGLNLDQDPRIAGRMAKCEVDGGGGGAEVRHRDVRVRSVPSEMSQEGEHDTVQCPVTHDMS